MLQEGGFATGKEPGEGIRWMAPELFEEGAVHTKESDMWAFGMTILVCDPWRQSLSSSYLFRYIGALFGGTTL